MLECLSKCMHHKILSTLLKQPNRLLDCLYLLQSIKKILFPTDSLLVTFDVKTLYLGIPTQEGILALWGMLLHSTFFIFSPKDVEFLDGVAELVLKCHFLEFNGSFYQQIRGTMMGNNSSFVYGCLFLCHLEKEVNRIIPSPKIKLFKRFIDDGFLVWFGSQDRLHTYLECYELIYPHNICITSCIYSTSVNLLDVVLFKGLDFQNF